MLLPAQAWRAGACRAFTAAMLLLLAGCSTNAELSRSERFDPAGRGLVVIGLRVVQEPVVRNMFFSRSLKPVYDLTLVRITPDGRTTRDTPSVRLCDRERIILGGLLSGCEASVTQYKVAAVPPGRYVLGQFNFTYSGAGPGATTRGASFTHLGRAGIPVEHPERSFEVKPGETVYIGDYTSSYPKYRTRPDLVVGRDDEAARRALAAYPNVGASSLAYRPALGELEPIGGPGSDILVE